MPCPHTRLCHGPLDGQMNQIMNQIVNWYINSNTMLHPSSVILQFLLYIISFRCMIKQYHKLFQLQLKKKIESQILSIRKKEWLF